MKKVLFAHQSTIPHYRIPFYNALERSRPSTWNFEVVFDPQEFVTPRIFSERIERESLNFPLLETNTYIFNFDGKRIFYQPFWSNAANYDLLILEDAVNNLTYPLCQLHQLHKTKVAFWGHGRDRKVSKLTTLKQLSEAFKLWRCKRADGFFAYTQGVKDYLVAKGVTADKISVVNNTIDIVEQRKASEKYRHQRQIWRKEHGVDDKHVMLFIGRLSKNKRIDFLFEACKLLEQRTPNTHLILVGSGVLPEDVVKPQRITTFDSITDTELLAPIYAGADLFVCPGAVGLAPLQAFCHNLPIVTIQQSAHGPEVEYLSPLNSVMLPEGTTAAEYARTLLHLFSNEKQLHELRDNCWPSIRQYTIDAMAQNFILGIDTILTKK
jgi:glycosyltransferase involved in cell wall biosynthesis